MIYNIQDFTNEYIDYQTALKFKYSIAYDKDINGKKWYNGFNNFIEYQDFLNKIKNIKNRVFYEITKNETKLFFDFDKLNEVSMDITIFINEFINYFNVFFKKLITIDDLQIYNRDDNETNKINSLHIIITNFKTNKNIIKYFVSYLKIIMSNKIIDKLDDKIYTKNRIFNLPNNTKLKYLREDDGTNPKYFIDYKQQSDDPKKYLISYVDNHDVIEVDKYNKLAFELYKIFEKQRLNQLKNAFNKLKIKSADQVINKEKIIILEPTELLEYLIFNLPIEFFNNTNDWKQITILLKKFGLSETQFNKWNEKSILNIINTNWTKEQNKIYYDKININKCKSGKPTFKQIIEKYLNIEINFINYDVNLLNYLIEKTQINRDDIESILINLKNHKELTFLKNELIFNYDCYNGNLKQDKLLIGNYFIDVMMLDISQNLKLKNVITLENIEDIEPIINNFNTSTDKSILAVKAKWGSGKTHFISRNIINYTSQHTESRIIFLTENNSLNKQIVSQFRTGNINFTSHINTSKHELDNSNFNDEYEETEIINIVCSTESIQKINFRTTDILILDEFETILNHYESETFNNKQFSKFILFKNALEIVNKIVILDADLSNERLELISKITKLNIEPIHILTDNFKDYEFNYFFDKSHLNTSLNNDLKKDLKIIYASSSKNHLNVLYNNLCVVYPNKIIFKFTSDNVEINDINIKTSKAQILENLDEFININKIDVFLYSPSIKTGISINTEYFDKSYGYAHNKSVCSREFIQMLFRARVLKKKSINIATNTFIQKPKKNITNEKIKNYLLNPIYLLQTFKIFKDYTETEDIIDENFIKCDEDYLKLKIINLYENYNSQTRYTQDLLIRMIYNHNIKINFIDFVEPEEEEQPEEQQEEDDELKEINNSEFTNTKLYTLQELKENSKIKLNWRERNKHNFFYEIYFIKGITDKFIYDENIYNKINNDEFYEIYNNNEIKNKYNLLKSILNKNINNLQEELTNEINYKTNKNNEFTTYEHLKGQQIIIIKLLTHMNLNLKNLPIKMTNGEFETMIKNFNFTDFHKELKSYYDTYKLEHNFNFEFTDINYIKNMKKIIIDLLKCIDIHIKYVNKNTGGINDKMIFDFVNFTNDKKKYNGRLINEDMRVNKNDVKKTRNTFTYKNKKVYPTNNELYFTTYKVNINKLTKKIMNVVNIDDEIINKNKIKIMIELMKYIKKYNNPIIKTETEYFSIFSTF